MSYFKCNKRLILVRKIVYFAKFANSDKIDTEMRPKDIKQNEMNR
jgi:hypothetical protein